MVTHCHDTTRKLRCELVLGIVSIAIAGICYRPTATHATENLWNLARDKQSIHRFSTLFTAQNVRDLLSTDEGIDKAIDWCKKTGVTKVYIETFRDGYTAPEMC